MDGSPHAPRQRRWTLIVGALLLIVVALGGICAPWITPVDPTAIAPAARNRTPGEQVSYRNDEGERVTRTALLGTDRLGRDIESRVLYGARISLFVGIAVAALAIAIGLVIGLVSGYFRRLDGVLMRLMDGLMAIPPILLAIALVSLSGANLLTVIIAIAVPEVPRVARLVRSVVLTVREEPFVQAAVAMGTPTLKVLRWHILPNTLAPLIVQATYLCASAILIEAILSFLGVGLPSETPTWGNIMAEGRSVFQLYPHNILYPGIVLTLTVLATNLLGDGLRDRLDPRLRRRLA